MSVWRRRGSSNSRGSWRYLNHRPFARFASCTLQSRELDEGIELRFAIGSDTLLGVSVHPTVSALRVAGVIASWRGADPEREGEARRSQLGAVAWA